MPDSTPTSLDGPRREPSSVTLDQINRQRTLGWPDFHPEDYCHKCGRRNLSSWSVDSDRWNLAMGSPQGIVCPQCFIARWESATGLRAHWRLVPENIHWPEEQEDGGPSIYIFGEDD